MIGGVPVDTQARSAITSVQRCPPMPRFSAELVENPAKDFPDGRLSSVSSRRLGFRWGVLGLLVLLAFLPRAWIAWQRDVVCADGITYFTYCVALEEGDFHTAHNSYDLNVYPMILSALRRTGIDWEVVAKWWSVGLATLVVLPLFGWLRRMFDDRVAFWGSVLYALHPNFILVSPEVIRDPTFWLALTLFLYFYWRAVTENRLLLFLGAGSALAVCIHLRTEGWLLLLPLVLWGAGRLWAVSQGRKRLAAHLVVCLAVTPLLTVLINLTYLQDNDRWVFPRYSHFLTGWGRTFNAGPITAKPDSRVASPQASRRVVAPMMQRASTLTTEIAKAYTYLYGLLLLIGLWGWRQVFFRGEHLTLFLMNLSLCCGLLLIHPTCGMFGRYSFPVVLVSMPFCALGLLWTLQSLTELGGRCFSWQEGGRVGVLAAVLAIVVAAGAVDLVEGQSAVLARRSQTADLGKWVLRNLGPNQHIASTICECRVVEYYAQGSVSGTSRNDQYSVEPLFRAIETAGQRLSVVLLWNDWHNPNGLATYAEFLDRREELGFVFVDEDDLPESCRDVVVLVSTDAAQRMGALVQPPGVSRASLLKGP